MRLLTLLPILLLVLLTACGQKGALYLPDSVAEDPVLPAEETTAEPTSEPATPTTSNSDNNASTGGTSEPAEDEDDNQPPASTTAP